MTIPGLIGIMAPLGISLMYKALVIVVGGKTMAPLMFDCSRNLYAWAVDEHVSSVFARTSSRRVPHVALVTVAALTVFFLGESVYGGFQIGVALRAISLVLVSVAVGVGALRITYSKVFEDTDLRRHLLAGKGLAITSILTIVFGVGLIYFGLYQSGVPLLLQPGVQGALAAVVAALIYALSRSKSGSSCR
jgi:amino acid transporter